MGNKKSKVSNITVAGLGSIGSHIANRIALSDITNELIVIDPDKVEESNLETTIYERKHIGKAKVEAFKEIVEEKNKTKVWCYKNKFPIIGSHSELVLNCTDSKEEVHPYRKYTTCKISLIGKNVCLDGRNSKEKVPSQAHTCNNIGVTKKVLESLSELVVTSISNGEISKILQNELVVVSEIKNELIIPDYDEDISLYPNIKNFDLIKPLINIWELLYDYSNNKNVFDAEIQILDPITNTTIAIEKITKDDIKFDKFFDKINKMTNYYYYDNRYNIIDRLGLVGELVFEDPIILKISPYYYGA